jgi:hypothetical protein
MPEKTIGQSEGAILVAWMIRRDHALSDFPSSDATHAPNTVAYQLTATWMSVDWFTQEANRQYNTRHLPQE